MNILLALIPISLLLLLLAVAAFRWAVRHRQFEDLDSAALDILRDDRRPDPPAATGGPAPPGATQRRPGHDAD